MQISPYLMNPQTQSGPEKMIHQLQAASQAAQRNDPRAVAQASVECEAMFISHLLKQLRQGMLSGELAGGQRTEKYWAIADQEFSRHLAASGSLGLGRWIYRQLTRETVQKPKYQQLPAQPHQGLKASPETDAGARTEEPCDIGAQLQAS